MIRTIALAAAVAAAASLSACVPDSSSSTGSTSSHSSNAPAKGAAAPAGSSVRDGKFEFRVVSIERSQSVNSETPRGEFVVVTLAIENTGDEARSFSGTNQKLVDVAGHQYSANSAVDFSESGGDINPGLSVQSRVAFDVPPGTQVRELILHDSMLSGGAHLSI